MPRSRTRSRSRSQRRQRSRSRERRYSDRNTQGGRREEDRQDRQDRSKGGEKTSINSSAAKPKVEEKKEEVTKAVKESSSESDIVNVAIKQLPAKIRERLEKLFEEGLLKDNDLDLRSVTVFASLNEGLQDRVMTHMENERIYVANARSKSGFLIATCDKAKTGCLDARGLGAIDPWRSALVAMATPKQKIFDLEPERDWLDKHGTDPVKFHIDVSLYAEDIGGTTQVTVELPLSESSAEIKAKLVSMGITSIPPNQMRLHTEPIGFLKDRLSLAFYNLVDGASMELSKRGRSGVRYRKDHAVMLKRPKTQEKQSSSSPSDFLKLQNGAAGLTKPGGLLALAAPPGMAAPKAGGLPALAGLPPLPPLPSMPGLPRLPSPTGASNGAFGFGMSMPSVGGGMNFPGMGGGGLGLLGGSLPGMGTSFPSTGPCGGLGSPLGGLAPPVGGGLGSLGTSLGGLGASTGNLTAPPLGLGSTTGGLGSPTGGLGSTTGGLCSPTGGLGSPTGGLGSPTGGLGSPTGGLGSPTGGLGSPTGGLGSPTGGLNLGPPPSGFLGGLSSGCGMTGMACGLGTSMGGLSDGVCGSLGGCIPTKAGGLAMPAIPPGLSKAAGGAPTLGMGTMPSFGSMPALGLGASMPKLGLGDLPSMPKMPSLDFSGMPKMPSVGGCEGLQTPKLPAAFVMAPKKQGADGPPEATMGATAKGGGMPVPAP